MSTKNFDEVLAKVKAELEDPSAPTQTVTLHPVGKWGHCIILALVFFGWVGSHLHIVTDQEMGTIQVSIVGIALSKIAALWTYAKALTGAGK